MRTQARLAVGALAAMLLAGCAGSDYGSKQTVGTLAGAGAILAASTALFTALKLAGAVYLVWLGIQLWRAGGAAGEIVAAPAPAARPRMFWNAYVVTALNPKSVVFFARLGLDYVSCSPYRVPLARLAAAQAALSDVEPRRGRA